ncbi:AAA family ATPase [Mannheimia sp. HC-2023]|uniref:AAA family ATPase n=1 Tax=Mannheimia indoligenes TaxID=3103145 RepID=UPI002FE60034
MSDYKINSIQILGFWGEYTCKNNFNDDINIIIGRNGSGKTTFMNILHAALSIDMFELSECEFQEIKIILNNTDSNVAIEILKKDSDEERIPTITYRINNSEYKLPLPSVDSSIFIRRRMQERYSDLLEEMNKYVKLYSLSVYRNKNNHEYERDRNKLYKKGIYSSVDYYLDDLLSQFSKYQLELAQHSQLISEKLQKDVLLSLLDTNKRTSKRIITKEHERQKLKRTYKRFGFSDKDIDHKIDEYIDTVFTEIEEIEAFKKKSGIDDTFEFPSQALITKKIIDKVIELSSEADSKNEKIFSNNSLFLEILHTFTDKHFELNKGELNFIKNNQESLSLFRLSSGEKQLLILLIETLLQRKNRCIFLADEPEISLHIEWQREIISSVLALNPNAQIIVATHSPEIAGKHKSKIIKMNDIREFAGFVDER